MSVLLSAVLAAATVRPWTYWFANNALTDRETIATEYADIAADGFGGVLAIDSRGYWDDDNHLVLPPATMRWGSSDWFDLMADAIRTAATNRLAFALNVAASGGRLKGDVDVGFDAPKFLWARAYRPGEPFERPAIPHYTDIAVFAVQTDAPVEEPDWREVARGELVLRPVRARRELEDAAAGAALGDGWTLLRFGFGTAPGRETDIDVLDRKAVRRHLDRAVAPLLARVPELSGRDRTFTHLYNVSWEGAMPTWSATFADDFARIEGTALRPRLPALMGFVLPGEEAAATLDAFRHARGVMMREHLYDEVRAWAHEHGLDAFSESGGPWSRSAETFGTCDQLAFLGANDFPQGEFWPNGPTDAPQSGHANANGRFLVKGIVSAAHAYGSRLVSAEAFTHMYTHWSVDPAFLKPLADQAFADGVNLLVWHGYTSSPARFGVPGLEYFAGTHVNRNVTWHAAVPSFVGYLARCQALLQRGEPVTDVAVLVGDRAYVGWGTSANGRFRNRVSEEMPLRIPRGFAYDAVNDAALARDPSLLGRYAVVHDARSAAGRSGTVDVAGLLPDVETDSGYTWCHRRTPEEDVYFLAGEGPATLIFRAAAETVIRYDAVTDTRTPHPATRRRDGRTELALDLPQGGSTFLLFPRASSALQLPNCSTCQLVNVSSPATLTFAYPPGLRAVPPAPVVLTNLVDFTTREDLRHFSGTATYEMAFDLPAVPKEPAAVMLSLGRVPSGVAHVAMNGRDCGTAWCAPWTVAVDAAVRPGRNALTVRYVNNWTNRLIGDCALPPEARVTTSVLHYWDVPRAGDPSKPWLLRPTLYSGYSKFDRLQSSGLLGPIQVIIKGEGQ